MGDTNELVILRYSFTHFSRMFAEHQSCRHTVITVRNEVAKVMFLQVSVCPQGNLPQCMLGYHHYHPPPDQTPPQGADPPGSDPLPSPWSRPPLTPGSRSPPPQRWLLLRTVRILLECILVPKCLQSALDRPKNSQGYMMASVNVSDHK